MPMLGPHQGGDCQHTVTTLYNSGRTNQSRVGQTLLSAASDLAIALAFDFARVAADASFASL